MATVLERFNHLGLASSKPVLSKAGELVREKWRIHANTYQKHDDLMETSQFEDGQKILVNDYPEYFISYMDEVILNFVRS